MRVKKRFPDAKLPERATSKDSGADVFIYSFKDLYTVKGVHPVEASQVSLAPLDRVLIGTGLSVAVAPGYEIQVRPRSGNALRKGLIVVNSPGTIDSSYRGEVCVIIANVGPENVILQCGDKIAQLVVCPVILDDIVEVTDLDPTERGENGFGSTG